MFVRIICGRVSGIIALDDETATRVIQGHFRLDDVIGGFVDCLAFTSYIL